MTLATALKVRVEASADARNCVAVGYAAAGAAHPGAYDIALRGAQHPAQITLLAGGRLLIAAYIPELKAGESVEIQLRRSEESPGRGIELLDQPENGRVVVNYSGFLQTIYHYGPANYKPRFYPITAPCARIGE